MATTSGLDLATLAVVNAREFLEEFLAALDEGITVTDTRDIVNLDADDRVDGIYLDLVDSEGGVEGEGEYVHRVMAVKKQDVALSFIRVTGFYQSYNGIDWNDDWEFVFPHEVTITQYTTER